MACFFAQATNNENEDFIAPWHHPCQHEACQSKDCVLLIPIDNRKDMSKDVLLI